MEGVTLMENEIITDKDIIEALECCSNNKPCKDCPLCGFFKVGKDPCRVVLTRGALAIINRQKADSVDMEECNGGD